MKPPREELSAVILAGGRARRFGGVDKGLLHFQGEPLVARICNALRPQVTEIHINANRNLETYRQFGYPVIADQLADNQGPLAGMQTALLQTTRPWLLTVPCDAPFMAADYAARMLHAAAGRGVTLAVAHDGDRLQPAHALLHRKLAADLTEFLRQGERKIDRWYARHNFATVDFSDQPRMFINLNTARQLAEIETRHAPPTKCKPRLA